MFSSKKIMYFIIMSALLLCFLRGIDFMANEAAASTVVELPGFAESGFSRLPEVSTVEDDGGNTAENQGGANDATSTATTESTETTGSDVTDPTSSSDVTDPSASQTESTVPSETETTTIPTTSTTTTTMTTATVTTTAQWTTTPTTRTTTTTRMTTTTTRATTTTTRTTTTTTTVYYDTGSVSFSVSELKIYAGQSVTNQVRFPFGGQKRAYFSSKDPSIVSVSAADDTTALITGVSSGVGWIQGISLSGDVCYCKVIVTDFTDEVLRLTNEQRRMYGMPDLEKGTSLMDQAAAVRLREAQNYFSHTRPNGQRFETVAGEVGLDYYRVGENLACGQTSPESVVTAWMNSPTHRDNILDASFERLSVAYGIGPDGLPYWVQFFWQDW